MTPQSGKQTVAIYISVNISQSKGNQTMKYGQIMQKMRQEDQFQTSSCFWKKVKASDLQLSFKIFRQPSTCHTIKTSCIPTNTRLDEDVLKTSSSTRIYSPYTSSEDVLIKLNILVLVIRLQDILLRRIQNVFKTSLRRFEDVFKTSSTHFENVFKTSSRCLQNVFRISSRRIIILVNTFSRYLRDIFKTFLRRTSKTLISRRICLVLTSEKFMVSVQNLQECKSFSNI